MHEILIIDDVVDKETQDLIEKSIFSPETQWTFGRTVFYHSHAEVTKQKQKTVMGFTKSLYRKDDNYADKDLELYLKPVEEAAKKINEKINTFLTVRIQLQLPLLVQKQYGIPHVDGRRPFPYMVAVYYVNDSDGDTVLFKQTTHNCTPEDIINERLEVAKTVPYKKGRLVVFNGDIYHASGKPTTDARCIINYNFI